MGHFRWVVDDLELKEVHLNGRAFTWSNTRECPTLERIDKALVSTEWEALFLASFLYALPSTTSYHYPLLMSTAFSFGTKKVFHFESFWPKFDGFQGTVSRAWRGKATLSDPLHNLDFLLKATGRAVQSYMQRRVGNICHQILMSKELLGRFDLVEEKRLLGSLER